MNEWVAYLGSVVFVAPVSWGRESSQQQIASKVARLVVCVRRFGEVGAVHGNSTVGSSPLVVRRELGGDCEKKNDGFGWPSL